MPVADGESCWMMLRVQGQWIAEILISSTVNAVLPDNFETDGFGRFIGLEMTVEQSHMR
jgi:hypothetical protein